MTYRCPFFQGFLNKLFAFLGWIGGSKSSPDEHTGWNQPLNATPICWNCACGGYTYFGLIVADGID